MCPPDPKTDDETTRAEDAAPEGDVDALLAIAKEKRAARDMKGCLEAYRAAAELGSAEASFAVALFSMNGGVVPQDPKEGTMHLRAAAEKGSVPAKVYLGNLYELGIHYRADAEKADVWYRNAARSAKIEEEPGTDEHARALAELGCVRYVLALVESGKAEGDEKARLLARAKAHGYGLKIKDGSALPEPDRATMTDALLVAEGPPAERQRANTTPGTKAAREKVETASRQRAADTVPPTKRKRGQPSPKVAEGLAAFGYAILFATAGVGAAYAAGLGARELVARGTALPGLGTRVDLVFPLVLAVVGILPAWLVYEASAFFKALVGAAVMGGVGWVAWGMGQSLHASRPAQAIAFALAGFLASLLVLGILGGAKTKAVR